MTKLYLGADHAGYGLKEKIKDFLDEEGIKYEDLTPEYKSASAEEAAEKVTEAVLQGGKGIIVGECGIGGNIAANRKDGIRAARITSIRDARTAREKHDANVLNLGEECTTTATAKRMIKAWLEGGT